MRTTHAKKPGRLTRAIDRVGATELPSGDWAYWDEAMDRYYVVSETDLESLCDYLDDENEQIASDAYSHWCAGTMAEEMPAGWTPDAADDAGTEEHTS